MKSSRILGVWMASCTMFLAANLSAAAGNGRTPLRIEQTIEANYPPSALQEGVSSGHVWMIISVDETGFLADALVTRYTHPAFAAEALSMLRSCKFHPAKVNGVPVSVRSDLYLSFESTGQVMTLDAGSTLHQLTAFGARPDYVDRICAPAELDQLPSPTQTVAPQHPGTAADGSVKPGRAMLDFIIDEHGVPRMPVLISSTDLSFGEAAADALSRWRFTPPVRKGKPIAVKVRQEFLFSTAETPDTPTGSAAKRLAAHVKERASQPLEIQSK
jgi:TonB family protein